MKPHVHILATCRNLELLPMTLLVFDSLRRGFPSSRVVVWDNANIGEARAAVREAAMRVDVDTIENLPQREVHATWVERLIDSEHQPLYLLDTDVVLWNNFEGWYFDAAIAGRQMPEFKDPYSNCISQPRLHTSLMYVDPERTRREVAAQRGSFPQNDPFQTPLANLVRAFWFVDSRGRRLFYDTCALLSYHVSAFAFEEKHLECFDHLHGGTYADLISPHYGRGNLVESYIQACQHPGYIKGAWRAHDRLFASLGKDVE